MKGGYRHIASAQQTFLFFISVLPLTSFLKTFHHKPKSLKETQLNSYKAVTESSTQGKKIMGRTDPGPKH